MTISGSVTCNSGDAALWSHDHSLYAPNRHHLHYTHFSCPTNWLSDSDTGELNTEFNICWGKVAPSLYIHIIMFNFNGCEPRGKNH